MARWLAVGIVLMLPLMACFDYYTVMRLQTTQPAGGWLIAAALAAPLALVGGASALMLASRRPDPTHPGRRRYIAALTIALACTVLPTVFLAIVWS